MSADVDRNCPRQSTAKTFDRPIPDARLQSKPPIDREIRPRLDNVAHLDLSAERRPKIQCFFRNQTDRQTTRESPSLPIKRLDQERLHHPKAPGRKTAGNRWTISAAERNGESEVKRCGSTSRHELMRLQQLREERDCLQPPSHLGDQSIGELLESPRCRRLRMRENDWNSVTD